MTVIQDAVLEKIARLSALEITPEEKETVAGKLKAIVAYVDQIQSLNIEGVPDLLLTDGLSFERQDVVDEEFSAEEILANAPAKGRQCFKIPRVV